MARLKWAPEAASDLEDICDYIAQDSREYASLFARSIFNLAERLRQFPKLGRVVPEYQRQDLRELIFQNYRIVYRASRTMVEVAAIVHGSRDLSKAAGFRF